MTSTNQHNYTIAPVPKDLSKSGRMPRGHWDGMLEAISKTTSSENAVCITISEFPKSFKSAIFSRVLHSKKCYGKKWHSHTRDGKLYIWLTVIEKT